MESISTLLLKHASQMIIRQELISCLKKPVCIIFMLSVMDVKFCISSCGLYAEGKIWILLLVRERSALADPYCQSTWNSVCLWVCLFVCLSATLRSNISKTKGARRKVTIGSL